MAVSIDEVLVPLPADGSVIRDDLIYLAGLIRLTIPVAPGNPGYQLVSMMGRWGTRLWNTYAIPALRAQFGDFAAGDWATFFWRGQGVDRNAATFASAPVTFENRSALFVDLSAVGACQISYNGNTYTSQGPPPGSTGTLAIWPGGSAPYPQTVVTMQCDVVGTAGNVPPLALPGYPAPLASGPPGVYIATAVSSPPGGNPIFLGSNGETDPALLARGRASRALGVPFPVVDKITAIILGTMLAGSPPTPVATNRIRIVGSNGSAIIYCATPSGPTPGSSADPATELGAINARAQLLLSFPGFTLGATAAGDLAIALGVITLYVTRKSNVTAANATVAANAALDLWTSTILPVGGFRETAGGQGWIYFDEVLAIAKSRVNATYPDQWLAGVLYGVGDSVSNLGQTFTATTGGTSGSVGPTGNGGTDGGSGLAWAPTTQTSSGSQFELAPGVFAATMPSFTDTTIAATQVATFSWTIAVVIVDQGN